MTGHVITTDYPITITHTDTQTKSGRPKRQYRAACACGWVDSWASVSRAAAVEHGQVHVSGAS